MYGSCAVGAESCGESYQLSEYCMTRFETVADSSRIGGITRAPATDTEDLIADITREAHAIRHDIENLRLRYGGCSISGPGA